MRYVLCTRDRVTGRAAVLGDTTFATSGEATAALGDGRVVAPPGSDIRLVDLDLATPVVVVMARSAEAIVRTEPVVAEEPALTGTAVAPTAGVAPEAMSADALDVPGEDRTEESEGAGETWTALEPVLEAGSEPSDEPDARHAADTRWPFMTPDDASVGPSVVGEDRVEDDAARSELWWAEVGSEEAVAEDMSAPSADTPRLGFDEAAAVVAEIGALAGEPAVEEESAPEAAAVQEPIPDLAEAPAEPDERAAQGAVEDGWASREDDDAGSGTSADGGFIRVDFDAWTCTDCIFTSTCPRAGADRPMTCGSFQWRAE